MTEKAKQAKAAYMRAWRQRNREKIRAYQKQYRAAHQKEYAEYQAKYWENKTKENETPTAE